MATLIEIDPATVPSAESAKPVNAANALGFKRLDVSEEAWKAGQRPERVFGFWRATVPEPNQKKKLFVNDEILMNLFRRLAEAALRESEL